MGYKVTTRAAEEAEWECEEACQWSVLWAGVGREMDGEQEFEG